MALDIEFRITSRSDPTGSVLTTLTVDGQMVRAGFRPVKWGEGTGLLQIHSDHVQATETNLARQNLVECWNVAETPAQFLFSWVLEEGDFDALSKKERAGRMLEFTGRGALSYLERAVFLDEPYDAGNPWRGTGTIEQPTWWAWLDEPWGAILRRGIEEGQQQPTTPLVDVTSSFTRLVDSDGNSWDTLAGLYRIPIGTRVDRVYRDAMRAGVVFQMGAGLEVQGYNSLGTDRSSATFAAGKVRFEAGVNIAADLSRKIHPRLQKSRMFVVGSDGEYALADPGGNYTPDVGNIGVLQVPEVGDPDILLVYGERALLETNKISDSCTFPHIPGDDELNGEYTPGKHYWLGDPVTVHTGTGEHDYNEHVLEVVAIRFYHDSAGNWLAQPELGGQTVTDAQRAIEERIISEIRTSRPNPELCRAGILGGDVTLYDLDFSEVHTVEVHHLSPVDTWPYGGSVDTSGAPNGQDGNPGIVKWSGAPGEGSNSPWLPAAPGDVWRLTVWLWANVNSGGNQVRLEFFESDGTLIISHGAPAYSANTWTQWQDEFTAPANTAYARVMASTAASSSAAYNDVLIERVGAVVGQPFDGHPDLIGTSVRAKRCDDTEHYFSESAPTVNDDASIGMRRGTHWVQVDDLDAPTEALGTWILIDTTDGAAIWLEIGGAVEAADVAYDNATSGLTADDVQEAIDELAAGLATAASDLSTYMEPHVAYDGTVVLDGNGDPVMVEVAF